MARHAALMFMRAMPPSRTPLDDAIDAIADMMPRRALMLMLPPATLYARCRRLHCFDLIATPF